MSNTFPKNCETCGQPFYHCHCCGDDKSKPSAPVAGSADTRDGPTAAAAEIVLELIGFPSLQLLDRVKAIIVKEITARGMPTTQP